MVAKSMTALGVVVFALVWLGMDGGPGVAAVAAAWCAGMPWAIMELLDFESA
jgi:hypothetical protein